MRYVPLFSARLETLFVYFFCCAVGFAESACPMTFGRVAAVQPKAVTLVNPLASFVRQDVVPNAVNIKKHRLTPLERELEAVEGISLTELGQPVPEVLGRVSVVTPTTASRARFHPQLWQCFVDQSWPDKELVVVETYHDEPSAFFQSIARVDSRLRYFAIKRPVGEDLTVGAKRNATILLASGQYCVNFDDDDLYADRYVESMVTQMQQRNLVALTLSGWHNFFEARGSAGYSEPKSWDAEDQDEMDEILYGYGFSYVHLRVMALFFPYPNLAFAEDAPFMLKLRQKMGGDRVGLLEDVDGLCLHIVHSKSSTPDPDISHELTEHQLNRLAVSDTNGFDLFMEGYSKCFSWFTGIFTSLFHCWSCWSDLQTCRSDQCQLISPISNFTISPNFASFSHVFTIFADCLWMWAKKPLHSSLERKLPGRCTSDSSAVLAPKTVHVLPSSLLEASIIEIFRCHYTIQDLQDFDLENSGTWDLGGSRLSKSGSAPSLVEALSASCRCWRWIFELSFDGSELEGCCGEAGESAAAWGD